MRGKTHICSNCNCHFKEIKQKIILVLKTINEVGCITLTERKQTGIKSGFKYLLSIEDMAGNRLSAYFLMELAKIPYIICRHSRFIHLFIYMMSLDSVSSS